VPPATIDRRKKGSIVTTDADARTTVHRCLAANACRNTETRDDRRRGAPTTEPGTLCPACLTCITSAVRHLPTDWVELRAALGERANSAGTKIRSTPAPAIPISTRKEALMAAIVDMADRAAAIVSDKLHTNQPTGRRKPPRIVVDGQTIVPRPGTPAWTSQTLTRALDQQLLTAAIAITLPNIDVLATAPPEPALVWKKPQRCNMHADLIGRAETMLAITNHRELEPARQNVRLAYAAAGACDDCNGWGTFGQERELVEISGMQIALELVELHHQARTELGLTRLRHRYPMPCPRCGGRVGRDDGQTIVTCDDRNTCRSSWTEREYQFLAGLITRERLDMEILKWLLAEAYWRLDTVRAVIGKLDGEPAIELPGAGQIITDSIKGLLAEHKSPSERAIATDRKTTEQRQATEDNWAWKNETPYRPPGRKPHKAIRSAGPPIAVSSLTTLVDIDEIAVINGDARCPECNLIHAGDCP
jgi:hypothetical protein